MNRRNISVILVPVLLILAAQLSTVEARASEARLGGLMGNPMVLDPVDIAELPGIVGANGNSVFLNATRAAPYANAGFLIGERFVAGAWVMRRDRWQDIEKTDEIFDSFDLPPEYNLFDLFIGTGVGFGLRLSLSAGLDAHDQRSVANSPELYSDGESIFGVEVAPGFTIARGRYHGDIGLGVRLSHFRVSQGGEVAYSSAFIPSFFLRHRSIIGSRQRVTNWVLDFYLTRRAYGANAEGTTVDEGRFGHWNTTLVAGPKFNLPHDFTVWGGIKAELEYLSGKLNIATPATGEITEVQQPKLIGIGAPGLVLSGELMLFDFLFIRAGVDYDVYWTISTVPDVGDADLDNDTDESAERDRGMGQRFAWSSGLGVALGDFELDGTVEQAFWFNGPDVIGGQGPGFLAMISATYMW